MVLYLANGSSLEMLIRFPMKDDAPEQPRIVLVPDAGVDGPGCNVSKTFWVCQWKWQTQAEVLAVQSEFTLEISA